MSVAAKPITLGVAFSVMVVVMMVRSGGGGRGKVVFASHAREKTVGGKQSIARGSADARWRRG